MRKMVSLLVVCLLFIGGMPITGIYGGSTNSLNEKQDTGDNQYHLGLIFEEPEEDKIVSHIYPEDGAPDVRDQGNTIRTSVTYVDNSYYLPPVGSQHKGDCVGFAVGYYHKGY